MKTFIIPALIVAAFNCSGQTKIMSFNIQQPYGTNWDARKDSVVAILKKERADIVGTQEAINFQRDYILSDVNNYSWFGKGRDGEDNGEGCWIFYNKEKFGIDSLKSGNFWLSSTPEVPSRFAGKYNRLCTYAYLIEKINGRKLYVFNVHNYMPEEKELRMKAIQLFIKKIDSLACNEKIIITGDFNSPEEDAVTIWLKKGIGNPLHLTDTYREINPHEFVTTGFGTKLDYIYMPSNQNHKVLKAYVASDNQASDHLAIIAEIIF